MTRVVALALAVVVAGCQAAPATSDAVPSTSGTEPTSVQATTAPSPTPGGASTPPAPAPTEAAAELRWTALGTSGPAPREDHTWTVGPGGSTAYLFGGRDGSTVHGDLWAFDLATDAWQRIEVSGGPDARFGHEAVWMDGIGLVIFAGQAGPTFFDDLWAFDPGASAWRELPSSGAAPTPRYGSCAAVGPDGRLWISHGFTSDGTRFADTRAWDPRSGAWTDETPAGSLPVNRCLHGCWWTEAGSLELFGGQTTGVTALDDRWILSDGGWSRIEGDQPPARNLYARVTLDGGTLVFGGQALDGGYLADAWWLPDDGGDADPVTVTGGNPPNGRSGAELIVDTAGSRLLLFGGRDADGAFGDLWQLEGLPSIGG